MTLEMFLNAVFVVCSRRVRQLGCKYRCQVYRVDCLDNTFISSPRFPFAVELVDKKKYGRTPPEHKIIHEAKNFHKLVFAIADYLIQWRE